MIYGYGLLPRLIQGTIGDVTINNGVINFTVTAITRAGNQWGTGPYNVIINETGLNAGFPGPLLTAVNVNSHKCFFWTKLGPPQGDCGCQEITPAFSVLPTSGAAAVPRTATFPLGADGEPLLPAVIDWDDGATATVTSGTTLNHTYAAGTYNPTYRPLDESEPTYTSVDVVVTP